MIDLLQWVLIPIVAVVVWWVSARLTRSAFGKLREDRDSRLRRYLRGVRHLLDEQPDQALRAFMDAAGVAETLDERVDAESFESYLIVGKLFRRRGDFDRAISIHQQLWQSESFGLRERGLALHELAQDYLGAGLYDRAEQLLRELIEQPRMRERGLRSLLSLYEIEHEWQLAIDTVRELLTERDQRDAAVRDPGPIEFRERDAEPEVFQRLLAHYELELALEALRQDDLATTRERIENAQKAAGDLPRTLLLRSDCAARQGQMEQAIAFAERAVLASPGLAALGVRRIEQYSLRLENKDRPHRDATTLEDALRTLNAMRPTPFAHIALMRAYRRQGRLERALEELRHVLGMRPVPTSGLLEAVRWMKILPAVEPYFGDFDAFEKALSHQLAYQSLYQCSHCGFEGRHHVWQCPSCRRWDTFRALDMDPDAQGNVALPGPEREAN